MCAGLLGLAGCAVDHAVEIADPACCREVGEAPAIETSDEGRDFAARVEHPARCEEAARARLPSAPDQAWRQLWACVQEGHFTALRGVLSGAWDTQLRTRSDAPLLVARIIAERGGDVDNDLKLLHERRVPLFGLAQALARPELYRGALVILRARISPHGILDERRLVSHFPEVQLGATDRVITQAAPPWSSDTRHFVTRRRAYNLDIATGQRVLALIDDPFIDADDTVVVLGRFDGLRDSDAWPVVSVLHHWQPSATLSY